MEIEHAAGAEPQLFGRSHVARHRRTIRKPSGSATTRCGRPRPTAPTPWRRAAWIAARTERIQRRHRDHADPRPHAGHDGHDRDDARRALRRPLPARARRLRAAGGRGLARPAVRQAARQDARVRRGRARASCGGRSRWSSRRVLPDPLRGRRRDRPRQAAQVDPARPRRPAHLPGRGRSQERRARRRDRRRLDSGVLLRPPRRSCSTSG